MGIFFKFSFMHWFLDPILKHYFDFTGRATRQQFWLFLLWVSILGVVLLLVSQMVINVLSGSDIKARGFYYSL